MLPIILSAVHNAYSTTCVFGGTTTSTNTLNTYGWIQINLLVILLSFSIAALVYALSNVFPASMGEKMKSAAKYEAFQGVVCIGIIMVLMAFSAITCNIGQTLVSSSTSITKTVYSDPMQYSQVYLGNLMFSKGLGLFTQIYSESVLLAITANTISTLEDFFSSAIGYSTSPDLVGFIFGMSGALGSAFEPLIVVSFGIIFMIYLLLPVIEALALTVIVPLSLIMRSIPFAGPKLRESADSIMALAIGFYFILPLAILMNGYIISWIYTPCSASSVICNPYGQYNAPYALSSIPTSQLFNQQTSAFPHSGSPISQIGSLSSFFSSPLSQYGGIFTIIEQLIQTMLQAPGVIVNLSISTAEYAFEGIVLIGIDLAITLAFAQGLTKGLNSTGKIIGAGPFWGNV